MIIARTVEVLEGQPGIYQQVQGQLRHLIVDEYQDINPAQERVIELLARDPVHLCNAGKGRVVLGIARPNGGW